MYDDNKILYWDHQISPMLIEKIEHAQKEIIIVSPYVKMWTHLKDNLEQAKKRGVQISLYFRSDDNKIDINELFPYFTHLIPIKNLHAKIYFIDDEVVVSSMNLYDYSQQSNKEIAILLRDQNQRNALRGYLDSKLKPFAERVQRQTQQYEYKSAKSNMSTDDMVKMILLRDQIKKNVPKSNYKSERNVKTQAKPSKPVSGIGAFVLKAADFLTNIQNQPGRCIRCGTSIEFDPFYPLCDKCYKEWVKYKNEDYIENFCHGCGKKSKTSYVKPLCYECFKQS